MWQGSGQSGQDLASALAEVAVWYWQIMEPMPVEQRFPCGRAEEG